MQPALRSVASRQCLRARAPLGVAGAQRAVSGRALAARRSQPVVALAGLKAKAAPAFVQVRGEASEPSRTLEEARAAVKATIDANPDKFGRFVEKREMDLEGFMSLFQSIAPGMGREETKALFVSMDASNDGIIQEAEIFSDITMAVLRTRMDHAGEMHPIEGSYNCLPNPPFKRDPRQLAAVAKLRVVYDEVLAAHLKPIPVVASSTKKPAPAAESTGVFASFFGGVRRTKPAKPAPTAAKAEVPKPNAPKGLYLYGGCGCGKTVLLDLFFRSLPEGFTARRLHWHEFIRDAFRSMQGHPPGENVFEAMGEGLARQFRVLLLDELVITHISEAILVKNLFRQLWARGVTVITTSNYRPEELYSKGFNRDQFVEFIPELSAQCPVFDMGGEHDYRKMDRSNASGFFHYPLDEATNQKMDKIFEEVVEGPIGKDLEVPIFQEKRSIKVPFHGLDKQGARVARFSFHDLCVKNLGRADYSTIAEHFHTVFVDGVPKFVPDLGAEFRRYVSLVDILYGKKVALYLQSEVDTDELFANSMMSPDLDMDELWAFRRCTSMMSEMQNPKYHHMVWLMRNHLLQEQAMKL